MRICGGQWKGRHLVSFKADHIRPTTDRVKESLFNIWQGSVEDARVLDLFAGTGSLGLEALSRGAREVLFVESHRQSIEIIRKNIELLKIEGGYRVYPKDVLQFLKTYDGEPFDLILIDPPFTKIMAHEVMQTLSASKAFHDTTLIAIESGTKEKIEDDYPPLFRYDLRPYGDKTLSLFHLKEVTPSE